MVDPKSRDYVANFRARYHPGTDFSSGRYIDLRAYAVSMRHVPPNVPTHETLWVAPLGPATRNDADRYRGPKQKVKQEGEAKSKVSESMFVKAERSGGTERKYTFHEDESWKASVARTPTGQGKKTKDAGGEDDGKEDEEGDTTLTDAGLQDTPPVKNLRVG